MDGDRQHLGGKQEPAGCVQVPEAVSERPRGCRAGVWSGGQGPG